MKRVTIALMCALLSTVTLTSCHDDDDTIVPESGAWTVSVAGSDDVLLSRLASYERLTVNISGYDAERDGAVVITSTEDWLAVTSDTLAADSVVLVAVTTNDESRRRTASLVFTSVNNPSLRGVLPVSQQSPTEQDANGADARSVLYVGYGYDIYAALDNPMSVRTKRPVIDLENLEANSGVFNFEAIHNSRMATTTVESYAATSIHEMATLLTGTSSNSDIDIAGSVETCKRAVNAAKKVEITEQNFGYGMMTKTVASKTLDMGALSYLRKLDSEDRNSNRLSLTYDFKKRLWEIESMQGEQRRNAITALLLEYGTHVVVQADLGGKIDYAFTLQRERSFRTDAEVREEVRYTIGQLGTKDRTEGLQEVSSDKSAAGAIQILGGSADSRKLLKDDIDKMKQNAQGQLSPEHMQKWLASISYSAALANDENLDVVHFELMPVWDLVPYSLRRDFLDATLLLAQRSDCKLPAQALGTDIYEMRPAKEQSLFNFNRINADASLCRLLYYEGTPVLQVCSEYVPKIRTDERVTVAYPIYKQRIRMNQGLFIGDGIHQPAFVSFSGGNCYVNPIDTLPQGEIVDVFYYVNGTLQMKNPTGLTVLTGKNRSVQEDYLYLYGNDDKTTTTRRHPIVKIGSKFWTRHDINHHMYFASAATGASTDQMEGGILYTRFEWEPNNVFMGSNAWTWGYQPNTFFAGNPNTKWYLPFANDIRELNAYLDFNPKALFKNQVSGWDAEFNGYYGMSDLKNQNRLFPGGARAMHYKGEMNIICSRNNTSERNACLMVLNPDYTIQLIDDTTNRNAYRYEWRNNFYPVRAIRGYMFEYPTLTTIKKNIK